MGTFDDSTSLPKKISTIDISSTTTKLNEVGSGIIKLGETDKFSRICTPDYSVSIDPIKANNNALIAQKIQNANNVTAAQAIANARRATTIRNGVNEVMVTLTNIAENEKIQFVASPTIEESRDAMYDEITVTHHPGSILAYRGSSTRTWNIGSIKLISRTPNEAADNVKLLNTIRSWVMPYYGYGTEAQYPEKLGAPPPVLILSAYGKSNIDSVKVVLLSYHFSYPNDIDYVPTSGKYQDIPEGTPFPILGDLSLSLKEAYSAKEYSSFDLKCYKRGHMSCAFSGNGDSVAIKTLPANATTVPNEESNATPVQSAEAKSDTPRNEVNNGSSGGSIQEYKNETYLPSINESDFTGGGGKFGGGGNSGTF